MIGITKRTLCRPRSLLYSIKSLPLASIQSFHTSKSVLNINSSNNDAKTNNGSDPFIEDDIRTANENNNLQVRIRPPRSFVSLPLDAKYRIGYQPLYTGPAIQYVNAAKRGSMVITGIGAYITFLLHSSVLFEDYLSYMSLFFTCLPFPLVQLYARNYVCRIFRLYDKTKPQTLENLIDNEQLVIEKLSYNGKNTYHQLVNVKDLKIDNSKVGLTSWYDIEPETKVKRHFYVTDDLGGIKMDRIWGIVEKNSNIDNGRFFGK